MSETTFTDIDRRHMARALELARLGLGRVEPNPMVGAVVADGERIIAEGWHRRFGDLHGEAAALRDTGERARGATLYLNLEPCCHQGKQPPCTDAIIGSGIRRVVASMEDPFAQVAGRGFRRLRQAGIEVEVGLMAEEARRLNAPFIKRQTTGRPYVVAKWAMTLDGRMAAPGGDSKWISSPPSRAWVHSLRSRTDGIMVGAGTVLKDDPQLTARPEAPEADFGRRPVRIVLDDALQLPLDSRLVATARETPVLVATLETADPDRVAALADRGVTVVELPPGAGGVDAAALLDELGRRDMTNLLVEGGREALATLFAGDLIDRLAVFIAPRLIGGPPRFVAPGPDGLDLMRDAVGLLRPSYTPIGDDVLVQGVLRDY